MMKHVALTPRTFLFLQGPPGPFFWELAQELKSRGCGIHRINLSGGDRADWPGQATDYRGPMRRWALFVDRYLRDHAITDLVLFGDCRPMHMAAHQLAKLRHIDVHVFEEGYIRPNWLTLEPDGVNGHSLMPRDPGYYRARAAHLPPLEAVPAITASFNRRARDAYRYYRHVVLGRWRFPFYRSHRPGSLLMEGLGWLWKFATRATRERRTREALERIEGKGYFLFPLQLSSDYQIRIHSPFAGMAEAAKYVLESFALHAPADAMLVVKEHPLDASFFSWYAFVRSVARSLGIWDRVACIPEGDLSLLARASHGVVVVNSTSATFALAEGIATMALGEAVYDMPGITHQGTLDEFWRAPQAPDAATYDAFQRVLHDECLVYGGLASESAIRTLVASTLERLLGPRKSQMEGLAVATRLG